jgi:hypothetical protein
MNMTTAATRDDVDRAGRGWNMLSKIAGWEQALIIGSTTLAIVSELLPPSTN